jgi:hypothetical protein
MRSLLIVIGLIAMLAPAHAQSPSSPLGPVSRDLLLAKLTDVQKSLDGLDATQARSKMERLAAMLEVDAHYALTNLPRKVRAILVRLQQDDLATASVEFEGIFDMLDNLPPDHLGTI